MPKSASILKCGHSMHSECQQELLRSGNAKCPLCNQSMFDMSEQWKQIDQMIEETIMPEEYQGWDVEILCSDCHEETTTIFHILGMKCSACGGYNTRRIGKEEAPETE